MPFKPSLSSAVFHAKTCPLCTFPLHIENNHAAHARRGGPSLALNRAEFRIIADQKRRARLMIRLALRSTRCEGPASLVSVFGEFRTHLGE